MQSSANTSNLNGGIIMRKRFVKEEKKSVHVYNARPLPRHSCTHGSGDQHLHPMRRIRKI